MIDLTPDMVLIGGGFAVVIVGLLFGSLTTALAYRVPRGLAWGKARSCCPSCRRTLSAIDLIPVFSWLAFGGRCRTCRAPIGWRYPVTEIAVAAACLGLYATWGWSPPFLFAMIATPFLAALLLIDFELLILPDVLQAILAVFGVLFAGALTVQSAQPISTALSHISGAVIFAALIWTTGWLVGRLRKRNSLGFGDVKFMGVAGLWLGLPALPTFLIASGVAGVGFGVIWRVAGRGAIFPFGPALIAAFYGCLLAKGAGLLTAGLLQ